MYEWMCVCNLGVLKVYLVKITCLIFLLKGKMESYRGFIRPEGCMHIYLLRFIEIVEGKIRHEWKN